MRRRFASALLTVAVLSVALLSVVLLTVAGGLVGRLFVRCTFVRRAILCRRSDRRSFDRRYFAVTFSTVAVLTADHLSRILSEFARALRCFTVSLLRIQCFVELLRWLVRRVALYFGRRQFGLTVVFGGSHSS